MQFVAYTAGPGVPNAIAHTTMNYRIDLIGQTSYVRTKPIFSHILPSRKQHAINCRLATYALCKRIQTRHPIFQLTDKRPNKPAGTQTQAPQRRHVQHALHAFYTAPKSIGEKADPPMRHRDERMQQLVPSVDTVYNDLRLAQLKKQTCFFAPACIL